MLFLRALSRAALPDGLVDWLVGWLLRTEEHKIYRVYGRKPKLEDDRSLSLPLALSLFFSGGKKRKESKRERSETRMHLYRAKRTKSICGSSGSTR